MSGCIYRITNTVNGNCYVGQTQRSPARRFKEHTRMAPRRATILQRAMSKYGSSEFVLEVIEETDDLDARERYWISVLQPKYNMTDGGFGVTNETRAKMSIGRRGILAWNSGRCGVYSGESLLKMSLSHKGKTSWNKGKPNPLAAVNGKSGAAKLSKTATGRRRRYRSDGSWGWVYPTT